MKQNKPYIIDGIVGNSKYLASLSRTGQMHRLWWPNISFPQHIKQMRSGLHIDGETAQTTWFDSDDCGWKHQIEYIHQTNIIKTKAYSDNYSIEATTTDYAVPNEDILVRHYSFYNRGNQPISFRFMYYSSFEIAENPLYNTTKFEEHTDALIHFRHQYVFSMSSPLLCTGYQAGNAWDACEEGYLNGNSIDMKPDGALCWNFDSIEPGETIHVPIYITAGSSIHQVNQVTEKAKSKPVGQWYHETVIYWKSFLQSATPCPIDHNEIVELYDRSLLVMKLMSDEQTGSISAAPEFDEYFSQCGGYAYCWGRDAAFITTALDKAGLSDLSSRFYDWALLAQDPNGSWQQRHYHDGTLAPSWGIQIDEGSSIIWGMWEHYKHTNNLAFAERVWLAVKLGAEFLIDYLDMETGLPLPSMDLWEERLAQHTYSAGAVFGGLMAASSFATLMGDDSLSELWRSKAETIRGSISELCWNADRDMFYRGLKLAVKKEIYEYSKEKGLSTSVITNSKGYQTYILDRDPIIDISLLGLAIPFNVFSVDDPRMIQTAATIERFLTVSGVGGIKRYENDTYIGGNPWILTTLWLAHYRIHQGEFKKAEDILQWTLDHKTEIGLLPEQVDKYTGETAWVVPLTWSHAMFVLAVHLLAEKNKNNFSKKAFSKQ